MFVPFHSDNAKRAFDYQITHTSIEDITHAKIEEINSLVSQMDISGPACLLVSSFAEQVNFSVSDLPPPYQGGDVKLEEKIQVAGGDYVEEPRYCSKKHYSTLQSARGIFGQIDKKTFKAARDATNPFEKIGKSGFKNRAAVKLANINAVYKLVPEFIEADTALLFCDVAGGPGGFTQYLFYTAPQAFGYGITLRDKKLDWDLNYYRFDKFYGQSGTGDLYVEWDAFVSHVLSKTMQQGVHLVTADGGFGVEEMEQGFERREFLNSRLLLVQAVVGVSCAAENGNFLLKTFGATGAVSAQIIYLLSHCFSTITLFKPVSSRPANEELYLVCKGRRPRDESAEAEKILEAAARRYTNGAFLSNIINELPQDFVEWLTEQNDLSINRQIDATRNILAYLSGEPPTLMQYFTPKFSLIWGLPVSD